MKNNSMYFLQFVIRRTKIIFKLKKLIHVENWEQHPNQTYGHEHGGSFNLKGRQKK